MRDLAVVDDGHGLETAVRVGAHTPAFRRRVEGGGAAEVQHQKGRERGRVVVVRKDAAHRKAVADPMAVRVALDVGHGFHRGGLLWTVILR